jgi:hypothetical protein
MNPDFSKPYEMVSLIKSNQPEKLRYAQDCLSRDPNNIFAHVTIETAQ